MEFRDFKVGQHVVFPQEYKDPAWAGKVGEVVECDSDDNSILVKTVTQRRSRARSEWFWEDSQGLVGLSLIPGKAQFEPGDEVLCVNGEPIGQVGKIVVVEGNHVEVNFPEWAGGHSGSSRLPEHGHWNFWGDDSWGTLVPYHRPEVAVEAPQDALSEFDVMQSVSDTLGALPAEVSERVVAYLYARFA